MRPAALFDMNAAFIRHGELHNPSSVIRSARGADSSDQRLSCLSEAPKLRMLGTSRSCRRYVVNRTRDRSMHD
jgi:hypothetical protein